MKEFYFKSDSSSVEELELELSIVQYLENKNQ
jgi:hypothetical protein